MPPRFRMDRVLRLCPRQRVDLLHPIPPCTPSTTMLCCSRQNTFVLLPCHTLVHITPIIGSHASQYTKGGAIQQSCIMALRNLNPRCTYTDVATVIINCCISNTHSAVPYKHQFYSLLLRCHANLDHINSLVVQHHNKFAHQFAVSQRRM